MIHTIEKQDVEYLVGSLVPFKRPLVPYDDLVCDFLNDLSSLLRSNVENRQFPDVLTFAFWCRRANISLMKSKFDASNVRLGLGLVFHIAPSNVPINFAYSLAFGMLSGNTNIVRVSSKNFPQTRIVCDAINCVLKDKQYSSLKELVAVVQYEKNDDITALYSENCNARITWGGDKTIKHIRKFPIAIRGIEIAFADRYSFSLIDTQAILNLNELQIKRLAEGFYNDTYLMDQNACSSPHLIVWFGKESEDAKERFWEAVLSQASEKYEMEAINSVDKYTLLCKNAIESDNLGTLKNYGNTLYRVSVKKLVNDIDTLRGKFGCFYEYDTNEFSSLVSIVNDKYQTLTYFGLDKVQLQDFVVKNHLLGIDRIVPIGSALDIGVIWDGYDIIRSLSRIIDIP